MVLEQKKKPFEKVKLKHKHSEPTLRMHSFLQCLYVAYTVGLCNICVNIKSSEFCTQCVSYVSLNSDYIHRDH
jgi:recombinational DNA repair protein RecR